VKPNGNILVFGTYHNIYQLGFILQNVLNRRILNSIVWFKPNAQPNITARTLTESTEQIIWAVNETPAKATGWTFNYWDAKEMNGGKQMRNLWDFPVTSKKERAAGKHPSQKPLALLERAVLLASQPGELLLDPFGGAGTLAVAAAKHGRDWLLIESVRVRGDRGAPPDVARRLARRGALIASDALMPCTAGPNRTAVADLVAAVNPVPSACAR
jgi:site-specific DNA-methyltransferase (adenine-specific)